MKGRLFALLTGLLAATALTAAKPVPPNDPVDDAVEGAVADMTRASWRSQGVPICVGRLRAIRAFTPDDLETICGCTFDSYLEGHGTNPLPGIERDSIPVAMEQQLLTCTGRTRPDQRSAVQRLGVIWPTGSPMIGRDPGVAPATDATKPIEEADTGPPAERDSGNGGGLREWLSSLSLPAWLSGASVLWWIALGIFVFGLLILKIRRRDTRQDLTGPPSAMRRGAPPQRPRRPDLPR
jgi:hypothetical protein